MVVTVSDQEFQMMKAALLDDDGAEAIDLIKIFVRRIEQLARQGLKSHLDG